MKKSVFSFIICLLFSVSFTPQQESVIPTGDLQYFELMGKVYSVDKHYLFPDEKVTFDRRGHIVIPGEVSYEEDYSPYLSEYKGPFKVVLWNCDCGDDFCWGVQLVYDSSDRLVKISLGVSDRYIYYDKRGRIRSILTISEGDADVAIITYDENGRRIKEFVYEPAAVLQTIGDKTYLSFDRSRIEKNGFVCYYEYDNYQTDAYGNWISRRVITKDRNENVTQVENELREGRIIYYM